jgi:hypothetical protein
MDLKTQRSRPAQSRRASESLKRNERLRPEGEIDGTPHTERVERFAHRVLDDATGVTVERIFCPIPGLDRPGEAIEKCWPARAENQRAERAGKKLLGRCGAGCRVEGGGGDRQ